MPETTTPRSGDAPSRRLDVDCLWRDDNLSILTTRWSRKRHPAQCEDQAQSASFEFMCCGSFRKRVGRTSLIGDPNTVVFFRPGETFKIEHPFGVRNQGTTIRLQAGLLHDVLENVPEDWAAAPAVTSSEVHLLQCKLVAHLDTRSGIEPLVVQDTALQILRTALRPHQRGEVVSVSSHRRDQTLERVVAVIEFLNRRYASSLRLQDVADVAGCSLWHIARVFVRLVGVPIHKYLKRLRLRQALAVLADWPGDLTGLALSVGFDSHSHFTSAFRKEFGSTPSRVRALIRSETGGRGFRSSRSGGWTRRSEAD